MSSGHRLGERYERRRKIIFLPSTHPCSFRWAVAIDICLHRYFDETTPNELIIISIFVPFFFALARLCCSILCMFRYEKNLFFHSEIRIYTYRSKITRRFTFSFDIFGFFFRIILVRPICLFVIFITIFPLSTGMVQRCAGVWKTNYMCFCALAYGIDNESDIIMLQ